MDHEQREHLNLAYRWFCRLGLNDKVPDHSTFSKNRHGHFRESNLLGFAVRRADRHKRPARRGQGRENGSVDFLIGAGRRIVAPKRDFIKDRGEYRPPANSAERIDMRGNHDTGLKTYLLLRHAIDFAGE
jgi:hypothetical protein